MVNAYDINPGSTTPKITSMSMSMSMSMTMLDLCSWTWSNRVFPEISPLVVHKNDQVRMPIGNLTMNKEPHLLPRP